LTRGDRLGYIETSVAGFVINDVGIPVITGTDNIQILFSVTGRQSARTVPVSIPFFIQEKTFYQLFSEIEIRIKVITLILRFFLEFFVGFIDFFNWDC
jgi:hypothetical protein